MYKVGSARIDERGKVRGGQEGDNNDQEVMIQDAYMHKNGWTIIRAKDPNVANGLAFVMACACNNDNIGYDQDERYKIFWTDVNVPTECDCSSLVAWCVRKCGITNFEVDGFYTGNEVDRLVGTGAFDVLPCNSIGNMCTGDILVDKRGTSHTVIVVEGKPRYDKTFDDPQPILRKGSQGQEVLKLQLFFNWICGQSLDCNSNYDEATEFAVICFQKFWGLQTDGVYGNDTRKALDFVLACNGFTAV